MNRAHSHRPLSNRSFIHGLVVVALCSVLLGTSCTTHGPTAKPVSKGDGNNFDPGSVVAVSGSAANQGSGTTGGSADAATASDASVPLSWSQCENVTAATEPSDGSPNSIQGPLDLEVTRISLGYSTDCSAPTVVLEMSNGSCPDHYNHWLRIEFDAAAIALHEVGLGAIDLETAHQLGQVNVRYQRPSGLTPSGLFGTCDAESGVITLTSAPDLSRGTLYAGNFQMTLNACPGTDGVPQDVQGTFNATLAANLSVLCPDLAFTP